MMHDRDDHDDSEYHFSDDQVNYDVEPEEVKPSAAPAAKIASAKTGDSPYRKPVVGILAGAFVVFLVYKVLVPAPAVTQATDFSQNNKPVSTSTAVIPVATQKPATPALPKVAVEETAPAPAVTPAATVAQETPPASVPAPVATVATTPTPAVTPPSVTPASSAPALSLEVAKPTVITPPAITSQPPSTPPPAATTPAQAVVAGLSSQASSVEKLVDLQEQNAKLVSQLQTEYSQKIAAYESQDSAMQGKLQDLSMRIASIETTLVRLGKTIQGLKKTPSAETPVAMNDSNAAAMPQTQSSLPNMPPRTVESRIAYTVQAIIPGRAWLKSDAGDTITVAEGDVLKSYGRITKIDPYDGIVEIDTGGKVVSLSYGASSG